MSALAAQAFIELLLIGLLYWGIQVFSEESFSSFIAWKFPTEGLWRYIFGGPLLALVAGSIALLLRAPQIPTALDQMEARSIPFPVIVVFAIVFGPVFEEMMFRGFLQRTIGLWSSSAIFALLHGAQSRWLWQYLAVMFFVSVVLGMVRKRTGSTVASLFLHMGFNLTAVISTLARST
jgi:membrane protease YdiL (CAAX protease family)